MSNTIELLEAIGKDASLCHATKEELAQVLAGMQASECLERAARLGDSGLLAQEFSLRGMQVMNHPTQELPPGEEEDSEHEDDDVQAGLETSEH